MDIAEDICEEGSSYWYAFLIVKREIDEVKENDITLLHDASMFLSVAFKNIDALQEGDTSL